MLTILPKVPYNNVVPGSVQWNAPCVVNPQNEKEILFLDTQSNDLVTYNVQSNQYAKLKVKKFEMINTRNTALKLKVFSISNTQNHVACVYTGSGSVPNECLLVCRIYNLAKQKWISYQVLDSRKSYSCSKGCCIEHKQFLIISGYLQFNHIRVFKFNPTNNYNLIQVATIAIPCHIGHRDIRQFVIVPQRYTSVGDDYNSDVTLSIMLLHGNVTEKSMQLVHINLSGININAKREQCKFNSNDNSQNMGHDHQVSWRIIELKRSIHEACKAGNLLTVTNKSWIIDACVARNRYVFCTIGTQGLCNVSGVDYTSGDKKSQCYVAFLDMKTWKFHLINNVELSSNEGFDWLHSFIYLPANVASFQCFHIIGRSHVNCYGKFENNGHLCLKLPSIPWKCERVLWIGHHKQKGSLLYRLPKSILFYLLTFIRLMLV